MGGATVSSVASTLTTSGSAARCELTNGDRVCTCLGAGLVDSCIDQPTSAQQDSSEPTTAGGRYNSTWMPLRRRAAANWSPPRRSGRTRRERSDALGSASTTVGLSQFPKSKRRGARRHDEITLLWKCTPRSNAAVVGVVGSGIQRRSNTTGESWDRSSSSGKDPPELKGPVRPHPRKHFVGLAGFEPTTPAPSQVRYQAALQPATSGCVRYRIAPSAVCAWPLIRMSTRTGLPSNPNSSERPLDESAVTCFRNPDVKSNKSRWRDRRLSGEQDPGCLPPRTG